MFKNKELPLYKVLSYIAVFDCLSIAGILYISFIFPDLFDNMVETAINIGSFMTVLIVWCLQIYFFFFKKPKLNNVENKSI